MKSDQPCGKAGFLGLIGVFRPTDLCEGFGLNNPQHMEDTE